MKTTEFIVMTASAKMPSSCRGRYGKVAVCEVEKGVWPKMISDRAKGMVRIVSLRDKLNIGGDRSAYGIAVTDAERLAKGLNNEARIERETIYAHLR